MELAKALQTCYGQSKKDINELSFDEMIAQTRARILEAVLPDVIFDGWSEATLAEAIKRAGVKESNAKLAFPRGVKDLVIHFHRAGDRELANVAPERLAGIKGISAQVEALIMTRLELAHPNKEAVRKASSYFSLPMNIGVGPSLIWETCDLIWKLVGVEDKGFSFYSRRASLAAIYSATFLYWLQDDQADWAQTQAFLKRRLQDLGNFHKMKAKLKQPFERAV